MKKLLFILLVLFNSKAIFAQEIFEAIRSNDMDKFMQLVQDPKNVNLSVTAQEHSQKYKNYTPLMCAVLYEREEMVRELLKRKAKPNAKATILEGYTIDNCEAVVKNYSPLLIAASKGNINIIKLLMRAKASTDIKGKIKFNHPKCYKTSGGYYVTEMEFGPQGFAELHKQEEAARVIRTAKGSQWIKERIK